MGLVYLTIKIMPESPETDLSAIQSKVEELISSYEGNFAKAEEEPVAFGLKALNVTFTVDESKGGTDELEEKMSDVEGVQSVQVTDVRRAIG